MTSTAVTAPASPYKGLAAYDDTELDALLFFGREADTEVIAANLLASRFTVLYGPAGVGKSSVLRAAVTRRVRALAPDAVVLVHDSWAGNALENLSATVAAALPGIEPPRSSVALAERVAELAALCGDRVYLILDQFEEVFTYSRGPEVAAELSELITREKLRVSVLLALRDDALSELDVFTGRVPDVFGNYIALERLARPAGRLAINGPLARYNELSPERLVAVEPQLAEAVLDEVETGRVVLDGAAPSAFGISRGGSIEAPYLQLVMQRIWEAERARGSEVLRLATLEELGGAQSIVHDHLDRAIDALAPDERDVAARVFNHLVTPSGTKVAHGVHDLAQYADVREEELRPVLASLGADRILRPLDGRFEIFHDVLADAVLAWRTRHEADRTLERERAEAARRHGRLLAVAASSLVAVAAMAALTVYALTQRGEARAEAERATARSLDAQASVLIPVAPPEVDPELGLLLAAEAARLSPTLRTEDILRRALLVSNLHRVLPERRVTTASLTGDQVVVATAAGVVHVYVGDERTPRATLPVGGPVTAVLPSPDGRLVLTTGSSGPTRLWEARTGRQLHAFGEPATGASFSPDGTLVVTVEPNRVRVWRVSDGSAVAELRQAGPTRQATFGHRGRLVATIGTGRVARVFVASSGKLLAAVDQGGTVTGAMLTPDERHLVTTGKNRTARVWSLRGGGRLVHEMRGHVGQVTAGALSPDGKLLATASTDSTARVWALATGSLVTTLVGHTNRVAGVAFSRDGTSVATWSTDRTVRVWRPSSGSVRAVLVGHGDAVSGVSFNASGGTLLTTSMDGRARLWRPPDTRLHRLAAVPQPIAAAAFSGDGRRVAIAGRNRVLVLDAVTGRRLATLSRDRVRTLAANGDGSLVAAAHATGMSIWRVATGELVVNLGTATTSVVFAPDGDSVAAGTAAAGIALWSVDGRRLSALRAPRAAVTSLAFSPDGDRVAAGFANGMVAAWQVRDGRLLYQRVAHRPGARVLSVAFSSSGGRLVTTGSDSQVFVLDAPSGRVSQTLRGHVATVTGAAFSPDGRWAVTAGPGTAGLWDLVRRQRLLFLEGHKGQLLAASFNTAGRRIATVGSDGTLRSYACETCGGIAELQQLAERRLAATGRQLTAAERLRYIGDR